MNIMLFLSSYDTGKYWASTDFDLKKKKKKKNTVIDYIFFSSPGINQC